MIRFAVLAPFLFPTLAFGQVLSSTQHVFPWIVDGQMNSGAVYRTELVLSNPNFGFATCTLQFGGLSPRIAALNGTSSTPLTVLNFAVFPSGYEVLRTLGNQPLASGYAVLNCSAPIYATSSFALFASTSASSPTAETTLPSSFGNTTIEYLFDYRNEARLGIALANPYLTPATFSLTLTGSVNGVWLVTVPAAAVVTRFLDELVSLPPNAIGKVVISDWAFSRNVYSIGLKFSPSTFAPVLPNLR